CRRALPRGCGLEIWCGRRRGRGYFDDEVVVPVLAEIVPGERQPQVLMSVTPAEILTLRPGVRLARGRVMIGGLGLGWLLHKVCIKRTVTDVTVVEQSQSLLDWLGPVLRERYPALRKVKRWLCYDAVAYA